MTRMRVAFTAMIGLCILFSRRDIPHRNATYKDFKTGTRNWGLGTALYRHGTNKGKGDKKGTVRDLLLQVLRHQSPVTASPVLGGFVAHAMPLQGRLRYIKGLGGCSRTHDKPLGGVTRQRCRRYEYPDARDACAVGLAGRIACFFLGTSG
ncbi:hypothetical protein GGR52DRAFT_357499 [Hypoxylon sp. FL1284]|nr:hypothetical protein GGR52DRAFT_357499 [Hypoxylon sp. FL1284]